MRDSEFIDEGNDFFADDEADTEAPRRDVWQRLSQLMVVCLFVLVLAGILRIFWPEIQRHRELSAEAHRLETIRDDRLARVAELQRQNEWMMTDREYLESIARDRLDMAHEHEVVVRIDRDSAARALELERERERQRKLEEELAAASALPAEEADANVSAASEDPPAAVNTEEASALTTTVEPLRARIVEQP